MRPLRILLSAYACEPGKGSEPGVGWRWALETARLGHDVWVITRENNRAGIERGWKAAGAPSNLHFVYYDLPIWTRWWKRGSRGIRLYYTLWQWGAYRAARRLLSEQHFDAVHHVTFGVIRHPSFMGRLGIPFMIGPLGGGERAPIALRRHFPARGQATELLRDLANWLAKLDPSVRTTFRQAQVILLKTPESMAWLPSRFKSKASLSLEIGIDLPPGSGLNGAHTDRVNRTFRLVYVGRFLYLKGMGLGIQAIAAARRAGIPIQLTLIGQGPAEDDWRELAERLGLAEHVLWIPWMTQEELLRSYGHFDALLFPSLHDSSGNVILEAMANGLPVICLNLGGPPCLVDGSCGRVVEVSGKVEEQVVQHLAESISELATDAGLAKSLREGARARARQLSWATIVGRTWGVDGLGCRAVMETVGQS